MYMDASNFENLISYEFYCQGKAVMITRQVGKQAHKNLPPKVFYTSCVNLPKIPASAAGRIIYCFQEPPLENSSCPLKYFSFELSESLFEEVDQEKSRQQ